MTVGAVVRRSMLLVFHCHACGRVAQVDAQALLEKFGRDTKLRVIKSRARCSNCAKRNLAIILRNPNAVHRKDGWIPYRPDDPMR